MSAAAECFCSDKQTDKSAEHSLTSKIKNRKRTGGSGSQNYSEGPEAKDDNDEVHSVSEEHEDVDVSDSAVLGLDQSSEELMERLIQRQTPGGHRGIVGNAV